MKAQTFLSHSVKETQKIAATLIKTLCLKQDVLPPHIFALSGNLGAGKTHFVQGVTKALKIKQKTLSPTFVIIKEFPLKKFVFKKFYHIDCYRLEKSSEIILLGFKDIIKNPENLIFIEWPEKIKKILPKKTVYIKFKIIDKNIRQITFSNHL